MLRTKNICNHVFSNGFILFKIRISIKARTIIIKRLSWI